MTRCKECSVVDLGINKIKRGGEIFELCPGCNAEDSVEEIDELEWLEDMALADADFQNELEEDFE